MNSIERNEIGHEQGGPNVRRIVYTTIALLFVAAGLSFRLDTPANAESSLAADRPLQEVLGDHCGGPANEEGAADSLGCKQELPPQERTDGTGIELELPTGLTYSGSQSGGVLSWDASSYDDTATTHVVYENGQAIADIPWTPEERGYYDVDGKAAFYWIVAKDGSTQTKTSKLIHVNSRMVEEGDYPIFEYGSSSRGWEKAPIVMHLAARLRLNNGDEQRSLFHDVTPIRAGLAGDDLARYDGLVDNLRNSMAGPAKDLSDPNETMDPSTRYLIAAYTVEAFWTRPDYINKLTDDLQGHIYLHPESGRSYYKCRQQFFGKPAKMDLRGLRLHEGVPRVLVHELAHGLDCRGRLGHINGEPGGATGVQESVIRHEYDRLCFVHRTSGDVGVLKPYSLSNRVEFWADASSFFLTDSYTRNRMYSETPALYNALRGIYRMENLSEAAVPAYDYPHSCNSFDPPPPPNGGEGEGEGGSL